MLHGKLFYSLLVPENDPSSSPKRKRWLLSPYFNNIHVAESEPPLHDEFDDPDALPDYSYHRTPDIRTSLPVQNSNWYGPPSQQPRFGQLIDSDAVLFNPCNLVCQVRAVPVIGYTDIYELSPVEVSIVRDILDIAKESPYWYSNVVGYQPVLGTTALGVPLQPAVCLCKHCAQIGVTEFRNELGFPHQPLDCCTLNDFESNRVSSFFINNHMTQQQMYTERTQGYPQSTLYTERPYSTDNPSMSIQAACQQAKGFEDPNPPVTTLKPILKLAREEFSRLLPRLQRDSSHPVLDISGLRVSELQDRRSAFNGRGSSNDRSPKSPIEEENAYWQHQHWTDTARMVGDVPDTYSPVAQYHVERQDQPRYAIPSIYEGVYSTYPPPSIATMATGLASPVYQNRPQLLNVVPSQYLITNIPFSTNGSRVYPASPLSSVVIPSVPSFPGSPVNQMISPANVPTKPFYVAKGQPFKQSLGVCFSYAATVGIPQTTQPVIRSDILHPMAEQKSGWISAPMRPPFIPAAAYTHFAPVQQTTTTQQQHLSSNDLKIDDSDRSGIEPIDEPSSNKMEPSRLPSVLLQEVGASRKEGTNEQEEKHESLRLPTLMNQTGGGICDDEGFRQSSRRISGQSTRHSGMFVNPSLPNFFNPISWSFSIS